MRNSSRLAVVLTLAAATFTVSAQFSVAQAQRAFPTRPIELIIPYAPGGGSGITGEVMKKIISDDKLTPQPIKIALGDTIDWRMTGQVTSDTLVISLKNEEQAWPFDGPMPAGRSSARTGEARVKGTYGYNVHLLCKLPQGGSEPVVIDPDIIID